MDFEAIYMDLILTLTKFSRGTQIQSLILIIPCFSRGISNILKLVMHKPQITLELLIIIEVCFQNHVFLQKLMVYNVQNLIQTHILPR